jgi:uncharacterized membrane-anchored protein YitT (DUF2179 family)
MTTFAANLHKHPRHLLADKKQLARLTAQLLLITGAALLGALSVILFLVPSGIAPGGVSGLAIILNRLVGSPIGVVTLVFNLPILVLAYRSLGGWRVIAGTMIYALLFSLFTDLLRPVFPAEGLSDNHLLNAIFAGIFGGISGGMTFRMGITGGGTAVLVRMLNMRFGIPNSSLTLYIDGVVVALSGLVFGWEAVMYAIISLGVYGAVCDYVLEGPSVIRTATIVTNHPDAVSNVILHTLHRGATSWEAEGVFTEATRTVLFVTVLRSQVTTLRDIVAAVDTDAFIVIGQGHVAYGRGFKRVTAD